MSQSERCDGRSTQSVFGIHRLKDKNELVNRFYVNVSI